MSYSRWKEEYVDTLRKNDIINNIRERIQSGEISLNIDQGKHILGHNNYKDGRSYLTISLDEAQELINKYVAGHGSIKLTRIGNWNNKESVVAKKTVGVAIDPSNGKEYPTRKFIIHFSKKALI